MADLGEGSKKLTLGQGETELLNNPAKTHLSPTAPPLCAGPKWLSHAQLFATPWPETRQALCPWGFSRQE